MKDTTEYQVSGAGCFSEIDAKAPSLASDALKEREWCGSSSEGATCGVSDLSGITDNEYYAPSNRAKDALNDLVGAYAAANAMLIGLREENKNLREQLAELMDESRLFAEWKEKLREIREMTK